MPSPPQRSDRQIDFVRLMQRFRHALEKVEPDGSERVHGAPVPQRLESRFDDVAAPGGRRGAACRRARIARFGSSMPMATASIANRGHHVGGRRRFPTPRFTYQTASAQAAWPGRAGMATGKDSNQCTSTRSTIGGAVRLLRIMGDDGKAP